jgi:GWxTD domain-containing protein
MRRPLLKSVLRGGKRMNWKRSAGFFLAVFLTAVQFAGAQAEMKPVRVEATPMFYFDAISYSSETPEKSRIDFYVQVPYEELRFVKDGSQYTAKYDVVLTVAKPDQQVIQERIWSVEVRLEEFTQTVSRSAYSLTQRAVDVDPGDYIISVQVRDQDSRKTSRIRKALLVTDYRDLPLSLSDIMLVSRLTTDGGKKRIVPNISGNITSMGEGFFMFLEIYNQEPGDSVELVWRILDKDKAEVAASRQTEQTLDEKTQAFLKVEGLRLPVGNYFIMVEAFPTVEPDSAAPVRATTTRTFSVRWTDIPASITDLKKAVEQLKYIAQPSEHDYMRNAENDEEMRKRFLEFWAKRDTDPNTPRNELMEEYYRRVEYANQNFGHYMEGWRTDRGMIYVRFGPPDNVDRHPFEMSSKPYEVWYYYDLERQFVFVDETGFGDYRLRYPTTDLWGRVR